MSNIKKSKKAIGQGTIIGIVLLLLTVFVVAYAASLSLQKAEAQAEVGSCRTTNQYVVTSEVSELGHTFTFRTPVTCKTIVLDSKVPTKNYKGKYENDVKAAEAEIGDLIKNCWYMWLEGTSAKVFPPEGWFGGEGRNGCFICYEFDVDYNFNTWELEKSMQLRAMKDENDGTYYDYISKKNVKRGGGLDIDDEAMDNFHGKFVITFHSYTERWQSLWLGGSDAYLKVTSLDNARECARNMVGQEDS